MTLCFKNQWPGLYIRCPQHWVISHDIGASVVLLLAMLPFFILLCNYEARLFDGLGDICVWSTTYPRQIFIAKNSVTIAHVLCIICSVIAWLFRIYLFGIHLCLCLIVQLHVFYTHFQNSLIKCHTYCLNNRLTLAIKYRLNTRECWCSSKEPDMQGVSQVTENGWRLDVRQCGTCKYISRDKER